MNEVRALDAAASGNALFATAPHLRVARPVADLARTLMFRREMFEELQQ